MATQESGQDDEPSYLANSKQRMKSQSSEHDSKINEKYMTHNTKIISLEDLIQTKIKRNHTNYHKNSINLKTISSIIRDYKLEGPEHGSLFYGYSKRNSHPVVVKYSPEGLAPIIEIYDRFWKNIAMAKWPCVNRVMDFKR